MNRDSAAPAFARLSAPLASEVSVQDLRWERDLLALLCSLETLRTRWQDCCQRNQGVQALEVMWSMLERLRAFLDARPELLDGEPIAELRLKVEGYSAAAKQLRARLNRTTWQSLVWLFNGDAEAGDPHQQFIQCARQLEESIAEAFELFAGLFVAPAAAGGWNEARRMFLKDLHGLVEQLCA
jgi:hypothetical protein